MDIYSPTERSERMSKIKAKNTKPEIIVRRLVHAMGYRYRLHLRTLPGKPDLVFAKKKKVIFVHGCFWHSHDGCKKARMPKSNIDYWSSKIANNKNRDKTNESLLEKIGYKVFVVWECQIKNEDNMKKVLNEFLMG